MNRCTKATLLITLAAVGTTCLVFWERNRRRAIRRESEAREELGRWEGEGGAPPAGPEAPAFGRVPSSPAARTPAQSS
jgi:hypothetical protein